MFRTIKNTRARFLSIFVMVALAVAFLAGLRTTEPDMTKSADDYLDSTNLMDVHILSTLGLTEDDLEAVRALSGVTGAQGDYEVDAMVSSDDAAIVVKTMSLPDSGINEPYLISGRLPENAGECLVEETLLESLGLKTGDTITLDTGTGTYEDALSRSSFTIVGTCRSPLYISLQRGNSSLGTGTINSVVYLSRDAYALDYYTDIYVTLSGALELNAYSDEYDELVEAFTEASESFADERAQNRTDELVSEAQAEVDDARAEYEEAKAEAEEELEEALEELEEAGKELDSGWEEYYEALETLESETAQAQQQIEDAEEELAAAYAALVSGEAEYEESLAEYETAYAEYEEGLLACEAAYEELAAAGIDEESAALLLYEQSEELAAAQLKLQSAEEELSAARTELDSGWEEYYAGIAGVKEAQAELEASAALAQAQTDEAYEELVSGEEEYEEGLAEYEEAKEEAEEELAEAEEEIEDAQKQVDDIEECVWYVLDRSTNIGFAGYESDAQNMANLANIFPLIFFLVAALVCLTTMTRMVEEQRITTGGLKAMGYSKADIAMKFLGYGLIASVGGSILGLAVGCTLIPYIIMTCWQIMYSIPDIKFAFCPGIYILSAGAAVFVILAAALAAVLAALRETPASLMRPRTPKAGKRIFLERIKPLWKRLSFTYKVTVRNLFRYKKRFWMTLIGIGGCTGLIITGFGLRDSITDILDIQYEELSLYDAYAVVEEEDLEDLYAVLDENELVADYTAVNVSSMDFEGGSTVISGYMLVMEDQESVDGFMVFRQRKGKTAVEITDEGIYISEKLSLLMGLEAGDTVTLSGDERVSAYVAGIVENHVYNYVYMTQEYYESLYGTAAEYNEVMLVYTDSSEETEDAVSEALLNADLITSISQIADLRETMNNSFSVINYVVIVIIVAAAALAFVVLFNLSSINITERRRELATLKVLGFNDKEMNAYVLRENVILTVIGTVIGLALGKVLHLYLVSTIELEMIMFGRSVHPASYIAGAALTIVFSVIVNMTAGRSLRKIDMVESLKSVE